MGTMFETPKPKDASSQKTMWIIIVVVIVVVAVGFYFYTSKGTTAPATASAPAAASAPADATNDLRVTSVKMEKDSTGTTAVWLIDLRNRSNTYGYSHIAYETTYTGADGATLAVNRGELKDPIGPGEEVNETLRDTAFPTGTASYRLKITGATSAVPAQ
jgi:hypothetical protein